jgi:hypothetical protein
MTDDSHKDESEDREVERQRQFRASNPGLDKGRGYCSPENYTFREASELLTSQPEIWEDGFKDHFWNLGQLLLWVVTRSPEYVNAASDASGTLGKNATISETYGLAGASLLIEGHLSDEQARAAITEIKQLCVDGTLSATTQSVSISPDDWRHLEIELRDHMPMVISRWHESITHVTPDLRFSRKEVLRCFPPTDSFYDDDVATYFLLPENPPTGQLKPRRAWEILKKKHPDRRVLKLPPQKLADMATIHDRTVSGGTGTVFSREDILRALGKKR